MARRIAARASPVLLLIMLAIAPALALEARIAEIRIVGPNLLASVDLREMLPEKLRKVLESGGALHVRIQAELWEDRPLWDRLVRPALVTVFRIVRDPTTAHVAIADAVGPVLTARDLPSPLTLRLSIAPADAMSDEAKYYVRLNATVGTLAERDIEETGAAVFGQDDGTVSLGTVGKLIFNAVLQASDYLQSESSDARSSVFRKREIRPHGM